MNRDEASEILARRYGDVWAYDDPEWWAEMIADLMTFDSEQEWEVER